jgi:glyoxylase-like metal-dependent hydrolase (beta-lactamase superfamily II)
VAMPNHEVFALRYATVERTRNENFLAADPHDGPMPMDYYIWVIRGGGRTVLLDTGFDHDAARRRKREFLQHPADALRAFGIAPEEIEDVVVSHLHYDHAGNLDMFPNARFHLQDREMAFATGRAMRHALMRHPFDVEDVVGMVRLIYDGRVCFHDGDAPLFDGVSLHLIPGHAKGLQAMRVNTALGQVVLASDASHFYANMEDRNPFPVVVDVAATLEGYDRLRQLAESPDNIVPGHDPLVRERYPQVAGTGFEAWELHHR